MNHAQKSTTAVQQLKPLHLTTKLLEDISCITFIHLRLVFMSSREEVVELFTGASEVIDTLTLHLHLNHRTEHRKVR